MTVTRLKANKSKEETDSQMLSFLQYSVCPNGWEMRTEKDASSGFRELSRGTDWEN